MVNNPTAMGEIWFQSLGWEDPLEKGMATHFSILAWRIPWPEEPDRLQPMGSKESDTTERISFHIFSQANWDFPVWQIRLYID